MLPARTAPWRRVARPRVEGQPIVWRRVWTIVAWFAAVVVASLTLARLEYSARYLDIGIDYDTLIGATRNFLAGNGFYPASELAGAWTYVDGDPALRRPLPQQARGRVGLLLDHEQAPRHATGIHARAR